MWSKLSKPDLKFGICWSVLLIGGFINLTMGNSHESLWYDESYSAVLINHSVPDIINILAKDSHPPLYFIMLKLFCSVFGNTEFALRLFSALGAVALAALGAGPVKRVFGKTTGLIFTFIVLAVPISLSMGQETRMYTWAAFLVTGCVLYAYLAVTQGNKSDWFRFGLLTILSAYTHYYALLAVAILNVIIFACLVIKKRSELKKFFLTAGISVLCHLPWAIILIDQASRVKKNFWIPPVNVMTIISAIVYPFQNKFASMPYLYMIYLAIIASGIMFILIIFGIIRAGVKRFADGKAALLGFSVYILTLFGGIAASYILRPVFVERYCMPVIGLLLISMAYGISRLKKKPLIIAVCVIILGLSMPQIMLIKTERLNGPMKEVVEYMKANMRPDDIFVHTSEHTFGTFCYYFPEQKSYLYYEPGFLGFSGYDAFGPAGSNGSDVDSYIKGKKRIWLVENRDSGVSGILNVSVSLKATSDIERFSLPYSWYALSLNRVEPEN